MLTTVRAGGPGSIPGRATNVSLPHRIQINPGALKPHIQWVSVAPPCRKTAGGVKLTIQSSSSAEVKNAYIYTYTPLYVLVWCLI
jgi:hypothetical protein